MILVLRLGHRFGRDTRISTHCGLVARAFGAREIVFSGDKDQEMMSSVRKVSKQWGGPFSVKYQKNWRKVIKNFKGVKLQLTMYGLPIHKKIREIRKKRNLLIIIGGGKVPGEVYNLVDYNLSITNQPHSEIAALALFLYEYFQGRARKFKNKKIKIIPQERGKKVISVSSRKK